MEIKDVKANQGNVDVVGVVTKKDDPRLFEKFGKQGRVCNTVIKDDSGEVTLTLWNDDVDLVNVGDKIHVQNGWCSEYKGERQISSGKFGRIEVVEKSVVAPAKPVRKQEVKQDNTVFTNDPGMLHQGSESTLEGGEGEDLEVFDDEEIIE